MSLTIKCPKCGGKLQATMITWMVLDDITGDMTSDDTLEQVFDLYCEKDCFIAEDLTFDEISTPEAIMDVANHEAI